MLPLQAVKLPICISGIPDIVGRRKHRTLANFRNWVNESVPLFRQNYFSAENDLVHPAWEARFPAMKKYRLRSVNRAEKWRRFPWEQLRPFQRVEGDSCMVALPRQWSGEVSFGELANPDDTAHRPDSLRRFLVWCITAATFPGIRR